MKSINPANIQVIQDFPEHSPTEVDHILSLAQEAQSQWKKSTLEERSQLLLQAARILEDNQEEYARLITQEMGKLIGEARAEVLKCAGACRYYAQEGPRMLQDKLIETEFLKSYAVYQPLGVVLAVMPWNFPFWQVFRFAAPALMAGNGGVLKHASNVMGSALAIESVFQKAGFPTHLFRSLVIGSAQVERVIQSPVIKAVTLTGSELAGSKVAEAAGREIKKSLLELGGSDPFIVLEDADLEKAADTAIKARVNNCGQTCIAAKRFIVVESVADRFAELAMERMQALKPGDPLDPATNFAPLARPDLVTDLHQQVQSSLAQGAKLLCGGKPLEREGFYYAPTLVDLVRPGMALFDQESFGPAGVIVRAQDQAHAIALANACDYGLGGAVWTKDLKRGEEVARQVETGAVFVNGMTASHPKLPFGGIKKSGYGRELSELGMHEFVNIKTVVVQQG